MKTFTILIIAFFSFSSTIFAQKETNNINTGDKAPSFTAMDHEGKIFNSEDLLKEKNIVLIFYRGEWCPVCNRYLSNLQDSIKFIYEKNALVIVVSPDKPEKIERTRNKTKADFILLHDQDYIIMKDYDVAFKPEEKTINMYNSRLNAELEISEEREEILLPVPATFIIDQSGTIIYKHYNPDYKIRAVVKQIIDNLP